MKTLQKWVLGALVLIGLGATFAMYSQPDFMMTLANQVWGCF